MPDARTLDFATCDVFTDQPFGGNPLAIVLGADGLSTAQMQVIAREFNLSETIFVMAPRDAEHRARVRIFFPTAEIPFAGHPTIGCAIHLALQDAPDGPFDTTLVLEEEAGLVPVRVWRDDAGLRAEFIAPVLPHAPNDGSLPDAGIIADALGLSADDIGLPGHTPGLWQGGPAFLYVPVQDQARLAQARPSEPAWSAIMDQACVDSAYLYTADQSGRCDWQARMFSPTAGIPEDPATGSASAILAAQLAVSGGLEPGTNRIALRQGVEMGRPSDIALSVEVDTTGAITQVRIGGTAVPISSGQIRIPKPTR